MTRDARHKHPISPPTTGIHRSKPKEVWFGLGISTVFIISRIAWLALFPTLPESDFAQYHWLGIQIASGAFDYRFSGNTTAVGFILFLGPLYRIAGPALIVAKTAKLIMGLCALLLVYRQGMALSGVRQARWVAVLFCFWPVQIMYTSVLATKLLFLPLFLLACLDGFESLKGSST